MADLLAAIRVQRARPPDLTALMTKLLQASAAFMSAYEGEEGRLRWTVEEMKKISDGVKQKQEKTDTDRKVGTAAAVGFSILAAPFTGGLSLLAGATAGAAVALSDSEGVANVAKFMLESGDATKMRNYGSDLMRMVEPMKGELLQIKSLSEKLEEKSSKAEQDKCESEKQQLKSVIERVCEVRRTSEDALTQTVRVLTDLEVLVQLITKISTNNPTSQDDKTLRDWVIRSADQGQTVLEGFRKMREALEKLTNI